MLFTTNSFLMFVAIVAALFMLFGRSVWKRRVLLVASYVFYAGWDVRFLALLGATTLIDHFVSRKIAVSDDRSKRKRWLLLTLIFDLGVLAAFKYLNFFIGSFEDFLGLFGVNAGFPELKILMPLGISFYTFQSIAYVVDVYRDKRRPAESLEDYALFLSFFPQLLQGPIERGDMLDRLRAIPDGHSVNGWALRLCVLGAFKKLVLADNLGYVADPIFDDGNPVNSPAMLFGMYLYTFQLYLDFSGYTDFARGIGRFFNVELTDNFRSPYAADDPRDFWGRWHITLSTWLRDYLYIPLGGNRCSDLRRSFNLIMTMLLGGLWHGAAWTFVIWGGYHGFLLTVTHYLSKTAWYARVGAGRLGAAAKRVITFHLIALGWVIFRCRDMDAAGRAYAALAGVFDFSQWPEFFGVVFAVQMGPRVMIWTALMLGAGLAQNIWRGDTDEFLARSLDGRPYRQILFYTALLVLIILYTPELAPDFLYFQF